MNITKNIEDYLKAIFYLTFLAFALLFAASKIEAVEVSAFEQIYYRGTGTPVTETKIFHKINGLAKIKVINGGLEDADNGTTSRNHFQSITTVAGTGQYGYSGDGGPAIEADLKFPTDIAVDSIGNIYFSRW